LALILKSPFSGGDGRERERGIWGMGERRERESSFLAEEEVWYQYQKISVSFSFDFGFFFLRLN
jgi:hypothetical protein